MKILTYEYDKMVRAMQILNELHVFGLNQARLMAELGSILEAGAPGEVVKKTEETPGNGKGKNADAL